MGGDWLNDIKTRFKKNPTLYKLLVDLISPVEVNKFKDFKIIFEHLEKKRKPIVVNIGSGPFKLDERMINIDMSRYKNVDVIADIHRLPFKDGSVDGVVSIAVLEHVKEPNVVISEAHRILKNDGYIYTVVPFIVGFHAAPEDYQRYTSAGTSYLHKGFDCIEMGVYGGPTSGFLWILEEWLAMLFSFGITSLYKVLYLFFMGVLWPLKFLDIIMVRYGMATNIASTFYYLGRKK